ncbi:flagellar motor switch protein FliG [Stakelama saccharophila]|uniref:Flagellar motor switch protein FliG n=1 Tax=Stakelama saccharophila TaxID=3075605 RepID=A0ABZ0BBL3_9SPHN|nr:flagellar motor switch protein FliG [Stakelama sp. W311]WNO53694.1 flagellar motor switch protein FliG [Stakelama sp. W311]
MNAPTKTFNGIERAAVLMMLVGEEEAAAILQKLDPDEVRELGRAMFAVADVSEEDVAGVLDIFVACAVERTAIGFDPKPKIQTMMTRALGEEKAGNVLARITPPEAACAIELLEWLEPSEIAALIEDEHPQIAAVLIANLDPDVAAKVFELLPEASQPQILHRIARLGPITPEAIETLKDMLSRRMGASRTPAGLQLGGTRDAAKILSGARKATETRVMPKLAKLDRAMAKEIEEAMFVFDNLLELDDKNLGVLIRNIETDTLVRALKGVEEEARERFLGCMSSRAADGIRDEMEARGPMRLTEVLDAQKIVIATARSLGKEGTIIMGGGDDDYV